MTEQQEKELLMIRNRVKEDLLTSPISIFKDDAYKRCSIAEYEMLTASYADGTYFFTDLNYALENRTGWGATIAAYRLINLLKLGQLAASDAENAKAQALVLGHLKGFAARRYTNLNWWHLSIGLPQTIVRLLLMLEESLDRDLYAFLLSLVERGSISSHPEVLEQHKGANLIWFCDTSIIHALLIRDADELALAVEIIGKETYGRGDAGLQADGSFFQHGRFLYSLGYGRSYVITLAPLVYYLSGTSFAFTSQALDNIFSHILDGIRHMTHKRAFDYLTMGREYVRLDTTDAQSVEEAMAYLAKLTNVARIEEIKAFYKALREGKSPLSANKYFSVARYLTHQDEHLYVSFKALDETLIGTEICNLENVLGIHLSYATNTCVMRTGEEYRNIAPLLRYDYMPGTTCAEESDEEIEARSVPADNTLACRTPAVFLSKGGNYGDISVSIYHFERDGITQFASCIATPHGAIFLGSGQSSGEKTLHTTLEQCNVQGKVTVNENGRKVNHGGVCYVNHTASALSYSVEHRAGSWKRNSRFSEDITHEGEIFTLYTLHEGKAFTYAYEILSEEYESFVSSVLVNDSVMQKVRLADGREVCIRISDGEITVK